MLMIHTPGKAETKVKNSRFLAEVFPVFSPDEAKEAWRIRKDTYDNGGHIVYAFTVGKSQNISGCSDDGEPAGTAGRPVLAVLQGSGLTNAMITVARWFGGTKLGTGGLVHAYSDAAKAALANCVSIPLIPVLRVEFTIPGNLYSRCRYFLDSINFNTEKEEFTSSIFISGTIRECDREIFEKFITGLGSGKIVYSFFAV